MNENLKKIIFNKLYEDLSHVEIIPYKSSFWFIGREEKYWYLEYEKSGVLFFRHRFFTNFFSLFSMKHSEYQQIVSEWVEEMLNFKVNTTYGSNNEYYNQVEEMLNFKVNATIMREGYHYVPVEEMLNYTVSTIVGTGCLSPSLVEEILNHKHE